MELLENYLNKIEFDNYDDFKQNLKVIVPEDFDFARDIVDKWAEIEPNKLALLYCNDFNEERRYTGSVQEFRRCEMHDRRYRVLERS